jgi:hypothetical protein
MLILLGDVLFSLLIGFLHGIKFFLVSHFGFPLPDGLHLADFIVMLARSSQLVLHVQYHPSLCLHNFSAMCDDFMHLLCGILNRAYFCVFYLFQCRLKLLIKLIIHLFQLRVASIALFTEFLQALCRLFLEFLSILKLLLHLLVERPDVFVSLLHVFM